ncbi:hypothetical protein PMALA_055200 [Plasmodium malariae]|uniref:Uncharacterized protein n=1 Tax=Plasmodium malariae TaxID=5858 RepID=A0A1A8WUK2_PLAMA|nr:hypothetical protein PMALA_055200 [Plasmodium malariae]
MSVLRVPLDLLSAFGPTNNHLKWEFHNFEVNPLIHSGPEYVIINLNKPSNIPYPQKLSNTNDIDKTNNRNIGKANRNPYFLYIIFL